MIGGLFLMLSYFGCDQSQVQRYLTAKSINQARQSLLMSAYWKIPLQALILLTGVLVFVFFLFRPAPMLFNPVHASAIAASDRAGEYTGARSRVPAGLRVPADGGGGHGAGRDGRLGGRDRAGRIAAGDAAVQAVRLVPLTW